ncbi:MAG: Nif3-like dinuclear metal center hexameric protein [Spirochaetales bacterium]
MTLFELDSYFRSFLKPEAFPGDPSQNGIQVQNDNPKNTAVEKVAFAVDACLDTILQTAQAQAQVLVVHHGLFWGHEQCLVGYHYERIHALLKHNIALYACHIPLDANEDVGNNYGLAKQLGLTALSPFGNWHGMNIGVKGILPESLSIHDLATKAFPDEQKSITLLDFGKKKIQSVAIVSGGAGDMAEQAISEECDAFITGEIAHEQYHTALENKINIIAGGHYRSETVGVSLLAKKLQHEKKIQTIFIDSPTGL